MAKGTYLGISGVPHKVKKMYLGIGGVPRKVKKAYVGVGGVPKLAYSSEVSYYSGSGNVELLTYPQNIAAGGNSSYVLFTRDDQTYQQQSPVSVDYYNSSLVKGSGITLNGPRISQISNAVTYPDKAAFINYTYNLTYNYITWFNPSLVKVSRGWEVSSWGGELVVNIACNSGVTSVCGGYNGKGFDNNYVEGGGYIVWQATNVTTLSTPEYAWFPCGYWGGSNTSRIGLLNSSRIQSSIYASQPLADYGIAKVGNYVLLAGGYYIYNESNRGISNIVDVFDTNLVRTNASTLIYARSNLLGLTVESSAVFIGGLYGGSLTTPSPNVDIYDENLLHTTTSIPKGRFKMVGATVGNYGIAGGGFANYGVSQEDTRKLDIFEG